MAFLEATVHVPVWLVLLTIIVLIIVVAVDAAILWYDRQRARRIRFIRADRDALEEKLRELIPNFHYTYTED